MASGGSISLSHPAMYFPPPPDTSTFVENVIRITYEAAQPQSKDTAVVFKVKCSAPSKFHVHPRIGTMLVRQTTLSSSIALHVSAKEEGSACSSARSPVSYAARSAAVTPSTIGRGNGRDYQERFSVEAFLLLDDDDVAAAASEDSTVQTPSSKTQKLSALSQKLYDKAANRGGSSTASCVPIKSVGIKVYLDNVIMSGASPQAEHSCMVVPADADVRFLPFRAPSARSSLATPARASFHTGQGSLDTTTTTAGCESIAEETRRLKEELARLQNAIAETERDKRVLERGVAGSATILKKCEESFDRSEMRRDAETLEKTTPPKKRGVPFIVVLGMMFLTFVISLYFRLQSGQAITNPFGLHRAPTPHDFSPPHEL